MKRKVVLILIALLFFIVHSEAQRKTGRPLPKVHKGAAGSLVQPVSDKTLADWNAIHHTYAAKKYEPKDSWELVSYYDYSVTGNENSLEELQNMKIQILGDSILYLNGKKIKVCRTDRNPFMYERDALYYPYLKDYFALRGINISKSVPVLLIQSAEHEIYSDMLEYIYTGEYLVLYHNNIAGVFKYVRKSGQGQPSLDAKLEYTQADLYQDVKKEMSSKRAREYNIRPYKGELKSYWGDRVSLANSSGGFYFVKLPNYKSFPIFVAYNINDDDEFIIYTYKNGMIDEENSINILAFSSYNDIKEDFAIFTDGTIYVRTVEGKKTSIDVYRINDDGDFYRLE
ncbi:BTB/POZ domain-containing protein [Prevotella jejuni]|uniref:BTB/POZ domain-containing protein n=1 Tax=Prevotella jejuni TaxID=1177574 RepID=UPI001BA58B6B|nr:BTB/POZ domain-containing protein [Prevotella jejuni]QUB78848.1 BTB/POZ domain-containing protein [Prevotella jejuni]